jgi:hypothetical protein
MQRVISPRNENFNVLVQIKFLNIFLYISKKKTETNLLVQTKFYWSWTGVLVLIVRTGFVVCITTVCTSTR